MDAREYMLFARRTGHRQLLNMSVGKRCSCYCTAPNRSSLHVCANCERFTKLEFPHLENPPMVGTCWKLSNIAKDTVRGCYFYDTCEEFERRANLEEEIRSLTLEEKMYLEARAAAWKEIEERRERT